MFQGKYLRIATAMPKLQIGDIASNLKEIKKFITLAEKERTGILIFPPAALTGRYIGELAFHSFFYEKQIQAFVSIKKALKNKSVKVVLPCYLMLNGKVRFGNLTFSNGEIREFNCIENESEDGSILDIGGDIVFVSSSGYSLQNDRISMEFMKSDEANFDLSICVDDSLNYLGKQEIQRNKFKAITAQNGNSMVYISCGTYETVENGIFSGDMFVCEKGTIISEGRLYDDDEKIIFADVNLERNVSEKNTPSHVERAFTLEEMSMLAFNDIKYRKFVKNPFLSEDEGKRKKQIREILNMQVSALARRILHIKAEKAVIGVSGGLDSTLALIVCAKAMKKIGKKPSDVLAITMPGLGTSNKTKDFAHTLMSSLGVDIRTIPINGAVLAHFKDIRHDENLMNATYENAQARERTQILMDVANDVNGLVVGTGDMSEIALGWCTYNGDHMSMYSVNGGIPKTVIREIVKDCAENAKNKELADALTGIVNLPISPELIPAKKAGEIAQLTESAIGPYELHDFFLYHTLKNLAHPNELLQLACKTFENYDEYEIKKYLKIFYSRLSSQQFKRNAMPDGVFIFDISFSKNGGFSMPSDFTMKEWIAELE
ncbi:MAG: NAD(+) synthase [Eubacteriales bacterium]